MNGCGVNVLVFWVCLGRLVFWMISLSMIYMQVVDDDVSIFWYLAFCENFRLFLSPVWFRKYFVAVFLSLLERLLLFFCCVF